MPLREGRTVEKQEYSNFGPGSPMLKAFNKRRKLPPKQMSKLKRRKLPSEYPLQSTTMGGRRF